MWEETGYKVRIDSELVEKRGQKYGWDVEVLYFLTIVVAGSAFIQDPDELIHAVEWKSADDILTLDLAFPEDRSFLLELAGSNS